MRKKHLICGAILFLVCLLFIVDKEFFNKELFLYPIIQLQNSIVYGKEMPTLLKIVEKDKPGIFRADTADTERVNLLREWVNEQAIWSERTVDPTFQDEVDEKSVFGIYRIYATNRYGFDCGSFSVFLSKLYQLLGYETYIYDMGNRGQLQHAVVLVRIRDRFTSKLIVEDPYYNLTYVGTDGKPMEFTELLRRIKSREGGIGIKQSAGKGHKTLCYPDSVCKTDGKQIESRRKDGTVVFRDHFNPQAMKDNLSSFLYCRYLRYYSRFDSQIPVREEVGRYLLKKEIAPMVQFAPDQKVKQ